jgi:hypothetical protein
MDCSINTPAGGEAAPATYLPATEGTHIAPLVTLAALRHVRDKLARPIEVHPPQSITEGIDAGRGLGAGRLTRPADEGV